MEVDEIPINDQRGLNQANLDLYSRSYYDMNFLDDPINQKLKELETEAQTIKEKLSALYNDKSRDYEEKLGDEQQFTEALIDVQLQLTPLAEIRVIYAYKDFEVKFVRLIKAAYSQDSHKRTFKWENNIEFLRSKGLDTKKIEMYSEVNQLRMVNNSLKHSSIFDQNTINAVSEISSKEVRYDELIAFYERVSDSPSQFIESLKSLIYDDLYNFDREKILRIANSLALRMNKEDAKSLMKTLMNLY